MANIKGKDNFEVTPTVLGVNVSLVGHNHDHNTLTNYVASRHIDHSTLTLTAGNGLTGGGTLDVTRTISLNVNGLTTDATPDGAADYVVTYDTSAATHKRVLLNNLPGAASSGSFVEAYTSLGRPTTTNTWQTVTIPSAPANSTVQIVIFNDENGTYDFGVRAVGSVLSRFGPVGRNSTVTYTAKVNASSQLQWYSGAITTAIMFTYTGYIA